MISAHFLKLVVVPDGWVWSEPYCSPIRALLLLPLHQKSILGNLHSRISTQIDIPRLVNLAITGALTLDELVSNKFKLEEINDSESFASRWWFMYDAEQINLQTSFAANPIDGPRDRCDYKAAHAWNRLNGS